MFVRASSSGSRGSPTSLPSPVGLSSSEPVHRRSLFGRLSHSFSKRPLLGVVIVIGMIICASLLVPFYTLELFARRIHSHDYAIKPAYTTPRAQAYPIDNAAGVPLPQQPPPSWYPQAPSPPTPILPLSSDVPNVPSPLPVQTPVTNPLINLLRPRTGASLETLPAAKEKLEKVKDAMKHAWGSYERYCFGRDELKPLSHQCADWLGAGLTIIDSLSTLWVMDLKEEFARAREWVATKLHIEQLRGSVSFFETTIRILGGLLSAYDLSKDSIFLEKARQMGDKLLPAFNTPTGIPKATVDLASGMAMDLSWTGGSALLAELGTCQMEFFYLSKVTGDPKYRDAAMKPIMHVDAMHKALEGLYPIYINPYTGQFTNSKITFGAMGDSFYEYLLKMWLLTGKKDERFARMYRESMNGMIAHLLSQDSEGLWYIADLDGGMKQAKMDHLVCFAGGMLALGAKSGIVDAITAEKHLKIGGDITETCYQSYVRQPSKIGPEYMRFQPNLQVGDGAYHLRPEAIESIMIMYRMTGEQKWRDKGWEMFEAIERYCRVDGGYASLMDVRNPQLKDDKQESFFLAEALKYFYLLFASDTVVPMTENVAPDGKYMVFNTECHPLTKWD